MNGGVSIACLAHPEGELENLAQHGGFDFLDMSDSAKGSGTQSAGGWDSRTSLPISFTPLVTDHRSHTKFKFGRSHQLTHTQTSKDSVP